MEYLNGAITHTYKHRIFRVPGILFHKFNLLAPTFITITSKSCRQTPPQVLIHNLYISMHSMSPLSSHSNLPVLTSPPRVRRMATQQLSLFSPLLLMLLLLPFAADGSNEASHEIKKTIDVVVEGVVYCQSCDHAGTMSLIGATPIEFGRVGVSCKDHKGRVSFYKVFTTDAYGYFYVPLQDFKMSTTIWTTPSRPAQCNSSCPLTLNATSSPT